MPHSIPESREKLERRVLELSGLLELARALVAAPDAASALWQFLLSALGVVGATSAAIFRYHEPTGRLDLQMERGLLTNGFPTTVLSADEVAFLEGGEAREGVALKPRPVSAGAKHFAREQGRWIADYEGEAIVPLVGRGGLWGVTLFGPRLLGQTYGASELSVLATSAQIATSVLENLAFHSDAVDSHEDGKSSVPPLEDCSPRTLANLKGETNLTELRKQYPILREIVGESPSMIAAIREITQVAPTRCPALILGETGTGKELAARAIHNLSGRRDGPFEVIDCGSIPRELIESELFGHVKGAFTGATRDRRGAFELAHGGTLFLDEIGEMPAGAQTRLLRVLQEGQLRRVGDERTNHVDVRVVAATNRDLLADVKQGRFRADLYYRIGVFCVKLPPLRDRRGDMAILSRSLIDRIASENDRPPMQLSRALLRRLDEYSFPGNIRELQNILTVLLLRSSGDRPELEELEAILEQAGGGKATPQSGSSHVFPDDIDAPQGRRDAESTGRWVLDQLRRSDFNLSQTERALARIRKTPVGKSAAPVADRSSLTYYLQGECFKAFAECGFDLHSAARAVASIADLEPRARNRLEGFLEFIAGIVENHSDAAAARAACRERLPKLPVHYLPYLDAIAEAYLNGEWSLSGSTS